MFPAYPQPAFLPWTTLEAHGFDAEAMFLVSHAGTHMDAPNHVWRGRKAIDRIAVGDCIRPARLIDLRPLNARERITPTRLQKARRGTSFRRGDAAILRTGWEAELGRPRYLTGNPGLTEGGARELLRWGVSLVGIDAANLDHPASRRLEAHRVLLRAGVPVLENLSNLGAIRSPSFTLVALPLRLRRATGSPIRAVALVGPRNG